MLAVFFGWKQRSSWGIGACLPSRRLTPILSWAWGEVFPADKQLMSLTPSWNSLRHVITMGEHGADSRAELHQYCITKSSTDFVWDVWTVACTEPQQGDRVEVGRSKNILEAGSPSHSLRPLGVSGPLWEQKALQRWAEGAECGTGWEQSQRGKRTRHFSLGWCSWSRPWPQESSGPAWL